MIGLGLALAQPKRRVLVITGDGEMLMGLGSLATIGVQKPATCRIVVIDNERYGETGMQTTHTAHGVDLAAVARACGFKDSRVVTTKSGVARLRSAIHGKKGPLFAQVKVEAEKLPLVLPPHDGVLLKERFRAAPAWRSKGQNISTRRISSRRACGRTPACGCARASAASALYEPRWSQLKPWPAA